jgi:protein-S-isoprenylcysteine O-methyltransferase Ste14
MIARFTTGLYGLACYLIFLGSFVYSVGFIANVLVPKSIDTGTEPGLLPAIAIDVLLLSAFAIQHSVMARPWFKRRWTRMIPVSWERSTYVLISSLLFLLLFWQWRPIPVTVWRLDGWPAGVMIATSVLGWLIALTSTYLIDHFELFGLRQSFNWHGKKTRVTFRTPFLYRLVRHPLMFGFLLAFWATPHMTAGHLLFAVMMTGYILVGVALEEKDLLAQFGSAYERYRSRVPMLIPNVSLRRGKSPAEPDVTTLG